MIVDYLSSSKAVWFVDMSESDSGPPTGSLITALVQMERVNSIRDPVAQGTLGLRLFVSNQSEEQNEISRSLGSFRLFCDKFIEAVDYEKATESKDTNRADKLQESILIDPGTFTAVFSVFDKRSRLRIYPKIVKTRETVSRILEGEKPPEPDLKESLTIIRHLYKEIVDRTVGQERTAEKIIRGRAAIL